MKRQFTWYKIPQSRIATFDVYSVGLLKHHISALLEFDVTDSRSKLRDLRRNGCRASLTAWLIKVLSNAIQQHPEVAGYKFSKKRLIVFNNINVSIAIEKELDGRKVPIPLVIERTNEKNISEISQEIEDAKNQTISKEDIVLKRKSKAYERFYYLLPGFFRKVIWRFMLRHPRIAYKNMGNVMITSLSMVGRINGWFIHKSVHPISLGVGSIIKKPVVINDEIKAREILHMTILMDHDVIDGAPMVRFIKDLTSYIEGGDELATSNEL